MKYGRDWPRQARGGNHGDDGLDLTRAATGRRASRLAQAIGRDVSRSRRLGTRSTRWRPGYCANRSDRPIMTMPPSAGRRRPMNSRLPCTSVGRSSVQRRSVRNWRASARFQPGEVDASSSPGMPRSGYNEPGRRCGGGPALHRSSSTPDCGHRRLRPVGVRGSRRRTANWRAWLALPSSPASRSDLRGGLSPVALQRVQVFVEANLGTPIDLHDLAARGTPVLFISQERSRRPPA